MENKSYHTLYGLPSDVWTKIFHHVLSAICSEPKAMALQKMNVALVCKAFYLLTSNRQEMAEFVSDKSKWTKVVLAHMSEEAGFFELQQRYLTLCVKGVQRSDHGPVGFPKDSWVIKNLGLSAERALCFNSLTYLECQYLYLTELALFNRYFCWSYELLEQLRLQLKPSRSTQMKFHMVSKVTDHYSNKNLEKLPNIEQEHEVYLYCSHLFFTDKSIKNEFDFRYKHHMKDEKFCVIC